MILELIALALISHKINKMIESKDKIVNRKVIREQNRTIVDYGTKRVIYNKN